MERKEQQLEIAEQFEQMGWTSESDKESVFDEDEEGPAASALLRFVHGYAKFLLKSRVRYFVIILFLSYLALTVVGFMSLTYGTRREHLAPYDSAEAEYLKLERQAFAEFREVQVVFNGHFDYSDPKFQAETSVVFQKITASGFFHASPKMTRWWLRDYLDYLKTNETRYALARTDRHKWWDIFYEDFVGGTKRQWLVDHDIRTCPTERTDLCKSRGHAFSLKFDRSSQEVQWYEFTNRLESQFKAIGLFMYTQIFPLVETKRTTLYISVYYIIVTLVSAGSVAIFFVPHLVLIFWIVATLISEIMGLVGFLAFFGIDLDLISLTMLIINVGYVVDFVMHLSFDFLVAPGESRQDKAIHALTDVGHALIPAGAGTIMSVLAMSTTGLYIFEVYFRSITLAVFISAIHSCLFLPVMLSFFGPLTNQRSAELAEKANQLERPLFPKVRGGKPAAVFQQPTVSVVDVSNSDNVIFQSTSAATRSSSPSIWSIGLARARQKLKEKKEALGKQKESRQATNEEGISELEEANTDCWFGNGGVSDEMSSVDKTHNRRKKEQAGLEEKRHKTHRRLGLDDVNIVELVFGREKDARQAASSSHRYVRHHHQDRSNWQHSEIYHQQPQHTHRYGKQKPARNDDRTKGRNHRPRQRSTGHSDERRKHHHHPHSRRHSSHNTH